MIAPEARPATQREQLLDLLRLRGERGVTSLDALEQIGSFRLASRIWDLKQEGHVIEKRMVATSGGARIACYVLGDPAPAGLEQLALPL